MPLIDIAGLSRNEQHTPDAWQKMLDVAVPNNASDVHLTFQADGLHIAYRIDGQLMHQGVMPSHDDAWRLINHVKVMANIDLAERRRPQSGRAMGKVDDRVVDLRVAALPTSHGQDLVLRILDRTVALLNVEELGLSRRELNRLTGLVTTPAGLVLVTGATGSGKTTTLYSVLSKLNDGKRKIMTIENPVEYDLGGINQTQVNHRLGVGYGELLETTLQQDPDVIMIGEVRDEETAKAAVRAAATGHLVFATLHAVRASAAIESMLSLGAHPHFLARALRGVIAQNLVRRVCSECAEQISETEAALPVQDIQRLISEDEKPALAIGRGCDQCHQTGYRGRMGLFEIMIVDEKSRRLIEDRQPIDQIHQAATAGGMIPIQDSGKLAAFRGQTTVEEVLRVVPWDTAGQSA